MLWKVDEVAEGSRADLGQSRLLVAQDREIVISALMKLAGGASSFANESNVDAFLQQARSYDEATSSPLGWYLWNAQTRALSPPASNESQGNGPLVPKRTVQSPAGQEQGEEILPPRYATKWRR